MIKSFVLTCAAGTLAMMLTGCGGGGEGGTVVDGGNGDTGTGTGDGSTGTASVQDGYRSFLAGTPTLTWTPAEAFASYQHFEESRPHSYLEGTSYQRSDEAVQTFHPGSFGTNPCIPDAGDCSTASIEDFADLAPVMTHNGIPIVRSEFEDSYRPTTDAPIETIAGTSYGAWLDYHLFSIGTEKTDRYVSTEYPWVEGRLSGSNPPAPSIIGGATWTGAMLGADVSNSDAFGNLIMGDATLRLEDMGTPAVDVSFTRIWDLDANTQRSDMTWSDVPLADGVFTDRSGSAAPTITGAFFGPNHEEVGGVFDRDAIAGSFGAKRD